MPNYGRELAPVDEGVDTPDEFRVGMQVRVFNWSLDRAIGARASRKSISQSPRCAARQAARIQCVLSAE